MVGSSVSLAFWASDKTAFMKMVLLMIVAQFFWISDSSCSLIKIDSDIEVVPMKKDHKTIVVEYLRELSEEDLLFLVSRLSERKSGDLPEALNFLSRHEGVDMVLSSARSADALFDMCDKVRDAVIRECRFKGINIGRLVAA